MAAIKLDILWSPHLPDKFVTFGTDLRLYNLRLGNFSKSDSNGFNCDDGCVPKLLSVNSEAQYLKSVSWCPRDDYDNLLAVGQANGRIVLTSFNPHQDPNKLIGREFIPRHARQCNALAWNVVDSHLLAAGLEKYRTDCSLLVYDVHKSSSTYIGDTERKTLSSNYDSSASSAKAVYEYGNSETIHSLQWFNNNLKTLIAGCNQKSLKIVDIRESLRQPTSASTKAVYGTSIDPFNINRFATYFEHQVFIWDIRSFEKPISLVVIVNDTGPVVKVSWCPTRSNLLCSLNKDSTHLKLFDIQHTNVGSDELEPSVVERRLPSFGQRPLVSFCWHPFYENNLFTVNCNNEVHSHKVCERITLKWSPVSTLLWTQNKKVIHHFDQLADSQNIFNDISVKIRQRVLDGYGFELRKNIEVVKDDQELQNAWRWLEHEGKIIPYKGVITLGVHEIICKSANEKPNSNDGNGGNTTTTKSDCLGQSLSGVPTSNQSAVKVYRSIARDQAILLCGWNTDKDGINIMLDRLEATDSCQRAAAIALFNTKMLKAIQILQKESQRVVNQGNDGVSLAMVAMALSGYTEDKSSLWREMCDKLRPQLQDAYLRAMFGFLTSETDVYDDVLNEEGISVQDRIAFACTFLPDNKLYEYLSKYTNRMVDNGNLEGLLLTGLGNKGIELLQKYVDQTNDVQSASLIILQGVPTDLASDSRVLNWIESYRLLLDRWRLWHHRAQFDVTWHKADPTWKHTHQVYIVCHHCHKTISPLTYFMGRGKYYNSIAGGFNRTKVTMCINCRKSLPRCALCLIHMGSPAGSLAIKSSEIKINNIRDKKLGVFKDWFTWCQTCRHGGHADHIDDWFKNHAECPVTSCKCKCMSLDPLNRIEPSELLPSK